MHVKLSEKFIDEVEVEGKCVIEGDLTFFDKRKVLVRGPVMALLRVLHFEDANISRGDFNI